MNNVLIIFLVTFTAVCAWNMYTYWRERRDALKRLEAQRRKWNEWEEKRQRDSMERDRPYARNDDTE